MIICTNFSFAINFKILVLWQLPAAISVKFAKVPLLCGRGVGGNTCGYSLATPGIGYDRWMTTVFPHLHSFLQKIEKSYMKYPLLVFSYIYCGKCQDFFRTPYTLYFAAPNGRKVNFAPKNVQTFHFPQKLLLKMWPKSI